MKKAILLYLVLSISCLNFACQSTVCAKHKSGVAKSDAGISNAPPSDKSDRFYNAKFALKTAGEAAVIIPAAILVMYAMMRAGNFPNGYTPEKNESQENFNEWVLRR